ncbi:hypothetical protein E4T49_06078 [Aureobasidium sp. EXF-10728]|nr:hypothetical protein E4T49_06078 [Aureobasidium sp. EXF-10728]
MSSDSLAIFRKTMGDELGALAEQHYQHDLQSSDRAALQSAASRLSTHTTLGSIVGFSLGLYLSYRLRANRTAMFNAFRTSEKPVAVQFAGGRTEQLPDITPMLKPSTFGDIATYTLFGLGGLFVGGETGLLTGGLSAQRAIKKDPEAKKRIESAFRKFRAETLRLEADQLEKGQKVLGI